MPGPFELEIIQPENLTPPRYRTQNPKPNISDPESGFLILAQIFNYLTGLLVSTARKTPLRPLRSDVRSGPPRSRPPGVHRLASREPWALGASPHTE